MTAYSVAEAKNTLPTAASHTRPLCETNPDPASIVSTSRCGHALPLTSRPPLRTSSAGGRPELTHCEPSARPLSERHRNLNSPTVGTPSVWSM